MILNPIQARTKPKNKLNIILGSGVIGATSRIIYRQTARSMKTIDLLYKKKLPVFFLPLCLKYWSTAVFSDV
jgi:hypothetical protein